MMRRGMIEVGMLGWRLMAKSSTSVQYIVELRGAENGQLALLGWAQYN